MGDVGRRFGILGRWQSDTKSGIVRVEKFYSYPFVPRKAIQLNDYRTHRQSSNMSRMHILSTRTLLNRVKSITVELSITSNEEMHGFHSAFRTLVPSDSPGSSCTGSKIVYRVLGSGTTCGNQVATAQNGLK